ncbi:MAG TPA: MoxR family ATPase, partial [Longimicrobiales bacterium]|nr:MoxR family ATPase [Longimicrobiales bacterium]
MEATAAPSADEQDIALLERLAEVRRALEQEIGRRVVGQQSIVEGLLIALLADGHALLVGVPGLAKTLLISTLADALDLEFNRIQFTPDLMPSDITGTEVLEEDRSTGRRMFRFVKGPIFANVVLADEINRTPPKTQAALLQAMQERAVTAAGETMELDRPFFVLATQNPIEQEGTYPLPEAQLDRFMLELRIGYPTREEEEQIAMQTTGSAEPVVRPVLGADELVALQKLVRRVPAPPSLVSYAVRLVRSTRPDDEAAPDITRRYVSWGAGPRASQYLVLGAKARALTSGRYHVTYDDIRALSHPVLRHRVLTNFHAQSEGITSDAVVDRLLEAVQPPRS